MEMLLNHEGSKIWGMDRAVCNAKMMAYSFHGRWNECLHLLQEMEARNVAMNANTMASVVRCAGSAGLLCEAFSWFDIFAKDKGVAPDPRCWDALAKVEGGP